MKKKIPKELKFVALSATLFVSACSSYEADSQKARNAFYHRQFAEAAKDWESKANEEGRDQLLYLFDRGMALQLAGDYKTSEKDLLAADKMSEIKDYVSLSTEAATLVTNDNIKQYKGEDFEKVIVNAFLAIDYVLERNFEDALVECRRVNEKLYKYKYEAKKNYEQNPFARYLSAMIWEASGKLEDAYIDYKNTYEINPNFNLVKYDLLRLSHILGRDDDFQKWKSTFAEIHDWKPLPSNVLAKTGEVIVIYQQGKSAVKKPHPGARQFPKFYHRPSDTVRARLELNDPKRSQLSEQIYSVSDVAIKTLDDAYAGLIAKKLAGIGVKAVVADQVAQHNQLLGILTWVGLNAIDQADLRHWETLPDTLQIIRMHIPVGDHELKVVGLNNYGAETGEFESLRVHVEPNSMSFFNWRSVQ